MYSQENDTAHSVKLLLCSKYTFIDAHKVNLSMRLSGVILKFRLEFVVLSKYLVKNTDIRVFDCKHILPMPFLCSVYMSSRFRPFPLRKKDFRQVSFIGMSSL